jgi:hypothetical protein
MKKLLEYDKEKLKILCEEFLTINGFFKTRKIMQNIRKCFSVYNDKNGAYLSYRIYKKVPINKYNKYTGEPIESFEQEVHITQTGRGLRYSHADDGYKYIYNNKTKKITITDYEEWYPANTFN